MPVATNYLFQGSNIGPGGILGDSQDVPELLYLIQKKFFGLGNTLVDLNYTSEAHPNFVFNIPNAFPYIQQKKMYSQIIPLSNPFYSSGLNSLILNSNSYYQDLTFSNYGFSQNYARTMNTNRNCARYISCNYPYIAFYSTILLTSVTPSGGTSLYSNFATTYSHNLLQNTIPGPYDYSYMPHIFYSNTQVEITNQDGYWLLDPDAGLITFYDSNTGGSQVSASNPPYASFFRYEGLFGEASILQGQEL